MIRFDPYFANDTDGVHFQVCVGGIYVDAHVGRQVLARRFRVVASKADWVSVYWKHRSVIDACVERRVWRNGVETVIVHLDELAASAPRDDQG